MKQVLFIGGDADGIRRMVHDSTRSIESNEGRYFIHEYLTDRETLHFATQSEEADTCEIMQALFARYQQPIQSDGTGGVRQRCWEVYTDKNQPYIIKQLMHIVIHHIDSQAQRAEAAEEKLAELERQEPVATIMASELAVLKTGMYAVCDSTVHNRPDVKLYTRPAPAINLAELLPDNALREIDGVIDWINGLPIPTRSATKWLIKMSDLRAAILRNIEGVSDAEQ